MEGKHMMKMPSEKEMQKMMASGSQKDMPPKKMPMKKSMKKGY